jgi:hypothetical protein
MIMRRGALADLKKGSHDAVAQGRHTSNKDMHLPLQVLLLLLVLTWEGKTMGKEAPAFQSHHKSSGEGGLPILPRSLVRPEYLECSCCFWVVVSPVACAKQQEKPSKTAGF